MVAMVIHLLCVYINSFSATKLSVANLNENRYFFKSFEIVSCCWSKDIKFVGLKII